VDACVAELNSVAAPATARPSACALLYNIEKGGSGFRCARLLYVICGKKEDLTEGATHFLPPLDPSFCCLGVSDHVRRLYLLSSGP
jgi:hypothetical protein